jgi:alcohol dehydrogenase class IV
MNQKIYFETIQESLDKILNDLNVKSILLVTGNKSFEKSNVYQYFEDLKNKFYIHRVFEFSINPDYKDILRFSNEISTKKFDIIISIGGGSVIDFAKLLKYYKYVSLETQPENFNDQNIDNNLKHIAIPTTAGSGSEATHFAVMYKDKIKYSIANQCLAPEFVILDHTTTLFMTSYLTAYTGMDALCQSIESLWAKNATSLSQEYSIKALNYIIPSLKETVLNPSNISRKNMLLGAHFAGKAINISKTTAPHALAYYLTKEHEIPHGEAVGLNLDLFLVDNWDFLNNNHKTILIKLFNCSTINELIDDIIHLKKAIGLKASLNEVKDLSIDNYLNSVNLERMNNNPKSYSFNELKNRITEYHHL